MTWVMWAHHHSDKFWHLGKKKWVILHGLEHPVVEVVVTEDSDGEYWGWIYKDKDIPCFIWPSYVHLDICFPYGVKAAEKTEKGRVVRLRVELKDSKNG